MSEIRDDIWWIENYLDQALTESEKNEFSERLTREPKLQTKLDQHRETILAMKVIGHIEEKENLRAMFQEVKAEEKPKVFQMKPWYYAAAAVMVLLFATWLLIPSGSTPEQLGQQYDEMYPFTYKRSAPELEDSLFYRGGDLYEKGMYADAIPFFQEGLEEYPEQVRYHLFLGLAYDKTGQTDEALAELDKLIDHRTYRENALWFKALIYLRNGEKEEAKVLLEEIGRMEIHYRKGQALEILEGLE